jgi:hypothetical protein
VLSVKRTEGSKPGGGQFSADIQAAVRAELEMMLKAPFFAQSHRCKSFLNYVVLQTLSGNAGELKERTIGISVFDRANDYDTGETSIVRVTANEVRKRIGQYYRESQLSHPIQIELPKGAYVPEFRIQPAKRSRTSEDNASMDSLYRGPTATDFQTALQIPLPLIQGSETTVVNQSSLAPIKSPQEQRFRKRHIYLAFAILVLFAGCAVFGVWKIGKRKAGPEVWEAFSHSKVPILICIDTHDLHLPAASSPDSQKFVDMVLHKQIIALDDASVLSSMAGMLGKRDIPFRVAGAEQTSLTEFRRQPVILIGAIDNKWTLRLTQNLPYRIEVANPPGSGSNKEPVAAILDSEHPGNSTWTVDLSIPFSMWKSDYAIVAKVDDPTTGVPVLIEAGLGNDGSLAASELIASGTFVSGLAGEPTCKGKTNFEAVIGSDIIDTRPGPPHVLRLACW